MEKTSYDVIYKFVVIGDASVGKSSLLRQFTEKRFSPEQTHTIGVEFGSRICKLNDKSVKLQIWDTAGQERFRAVTRSYYRGALGMILVYDTTNRNTYNHLRTWLTDAKSLAPPNCIIMLVGNKTDLPNQREVNYEEAQKFATENSLMYCETSAKSGSNVEEMFLSIARKIQEKMQIEQPTCPPNGIISVSPNIRPPRTNGCC